MRLFFCEHPCREAYEHTQPSMKNMRGMPVCRACTLQTHRHPHSPTHAHTAARLCMHPVRLLTCRHEHPFVHTQDPELHSLVLYLSGDLCAGTQDHKMKGNLKAKLFPPLAETECSQSLATGASGSSQGDVKGSWADVEARREQRGWEGGG